MYAIKGGSTVVSYHEQQKTGVQRLRVPCVLLLCAQTRQIPTAGLTESPFFLILGKSAGGFEADAMAPAPPTEGPDPSANPWRVHPAPAAPAAVPFVACAATAWVLGIKFDGSDRLAAGSIPLWLRGSGAQGVTTAAGVNGRSGAPHQGRHGHVATTALWRS